MGKFLWDFLLEIIPGTTQNSWTEIFQPFGIKDSDFLPFQSPCHLWVMWIEIGTILSNWFVLDPTREAGGALHRWVLQNMIFWPDMGTKKTKMHVVYIKQAFPQCCIPIPCSQDRSFSLLAAQKSSLAGGRSPPLSKEDTLGSWPEEKGTAGKIVFQWFLSVVMASLKLSRPLPGLDSRSFSARSQRTGLLIHPEAHVPLPPRMSSISTISGQICLKLQTACVHVCLFRGTLGLSWLTSSEVFPNICVRWPPLPSSSRAGARPTSWILLQTLQTKTLAEKIQARLSADILLFKRLRLQLGS